MLLLRLSPAGFHSVIQTVSRVFAMRKNVNWMIDDRKIVLSDSCSKEPTIYFGNCKFIWNAEKRCAVIYLNVCLQEIFECFLQSGDKLPWFENFLKLYCIVLLSYLYFCLIENKYIPHRNYRFTQYYGQSRVIVVSVPLFKGTSEVGRPGNLILP